MSNAADQPWELIIEMPMILEDRVYKSSTPPIPVRECMCVMDAHLLSSQTSAGGRLGDLFGSNR